MRIGLFGEERRIFAMNLGLNQNFASPSEISLSDRARSIAEFDSHLTLSRAPPSYEQPMELPQFRQR